MNKTVALRQGIRSNFCLKIVFSTNFDSAWSVTFYLSVNGSRDHEVIVNKFFSQKTIVLTLLERHFD